MINLPVTCFYNNICPFFYSLKAGRIIIQNSFRVAELLSVAPNGIANILKCNQTKFVFSGWTNNSWHWLKSCYNQPTTNKWFPYSWFCTLNWKISILCSFTLCECSWNTSTLYSSASNTENPSRLSHHFLLLHFFICLIFIITSIHTNASVIISVHYAHTSVSLWKGRGQ